MGIKPFEFSPLDKERMREEWCIEGIVRYNGYSSITTGRKPD